MLKFWRGVRHQTKRKKGKKCSMYACMHIFPFPNLMFKHWVLADYNAVHFRMFRFDANFKIHPD